MLQVYRSAPIWIHDTGRKTLGRVKSSASELKNAHADTNAARVRTEELDRQVRHYLLTAGGHRIV